MPGALGEEKENGMVGNRTSGGRKESKKKGTKVDGNDDGVENDVRTK